MYNGDNQSCLQKIVCSLLTDWLTDWLTNWLLTSPTLAITIYKRGKKSLNFDIYLTSTWFSTLLRLSNYLSWISYIFKLPTLRTSEKRMMSFAVIINYTNRKLVFLTAVISVNVAWRHKNAWSFCGFRNSESGLGNTQTFSEIWKLLVNFTHTFAALRGDFLSNHENVFRVKEKKLTPVRKLTLYENDRISPF